MFWASAPTPNTALPIMARSKLLRVTEREKIANPIMDIIVKRTIDDLNNMVTFQILT